MHRHAEWHWNNITHITLLYYTRRAIAVYFETEQWRGVVGFFGGDICFIFFIPNGVVYPHTTHVLRMSRAVSTIDSGNSACANGITDRRWRRRRVSENSAIYDKF